MRLVAYVRVSTGEQAENGSGLEAQRQAIEQAASVRGWDVVRVCEDAGCSGKNMRRPGLEEALRMVEPGGGADGLVVAKLDRLSRSLADFSQLMERSQRRGWALIALDLGVDTSTPAGEMMANVLATFAQFERRLIGQRTREGLAVKRSEGVRLGRPPAASVELVERVRMLRERGLSYQAVADRLNEDEVPTPHGGAQWWPSSVRKLALRG